MICVGTNQGEKCEGGKENNHTDENLLRRKGFEVLLETKVDIKHWKVIEKEYQIGFTYPEAKGYKFPSAFLLSPASSLKLLRGQHQIWLRHLGPALCDFKSASNLNFIYIISISTIMI